MHEYSIIFCFGHGTTQKLIVIIYWANRSKTKNKTHHFMDIHRFFKKSSLKLREKTLAISTAE
jgi:hypothetical protein